MIAKDKCIIFLEQNGWRCDIDTPTDEYTSYHKDGYIDVDFNNDEMVFISNTGDFLHEPINYYTLVGVMIEFRQIDFGYASVK